MPRPYADDEPFAGFTERPIEMFVNSRLHEKSSLRVVKLSACV